jgi:hypothetical protein
VIRCRDQHRIDVAARQHLAVVARREELIAPALPGERQPSVVDVGGRHQFDAWRPQRREQILLAANPDADCGEADAVVRRRRL